MVLMSVSYQTDNDNLFCHCTRTRHMVSGGDSEGELEVVL